MPKPSWPAEDLLATGAPYEPMRSPQAPSWPPGALGESLLLRFDIKLFWSPDGSLRSSKFMCNTKPKEVPCWVLAPMQSFDPRISSAMAMAMSIYRTLCVLVLSDPGVPGVQSMGPFLFFWKFPPRDAHFFISFFI